MTINAAGREQQRLRELAREYRQQGYDVIVAPQASQLPAFLHEFCIDMLARNEHEQVVLEVRSQASMTNTPELDAIARVIQAHEGWRFELVVTNPRDREPAFLRGAQTLTRQDIAYRIREARQLSAQEHGEAAILLAWSATEALLRAIATDEAVPLVQHDPAQLIKSLFTFGLLDRAQYEVLQNTLTIRNTLAHGYKEARADAAALDQLLRVTDQLADRYLLA